MQHCISYICDTDKDYLFCINCQINHFEIYLVYSDINQCTQAINHHNVKQCTYHHKYIDF